MLRTAPMTGSLATRRHGSFRSCRIFHAPSARSTESQWLGWADFVEKVVVFDLLCWATAL